MKTPGETSQIRAKIKRNIGTTPGEIWVEVVKDVSSRELYKDIQVDLYKDTEVAV